MKAMALTYLELTVLSYPAAAIALIGSGALRGREHQIPLLINGGMNILNIIISSILIYGIFSAGPRVCRCRSQAHHRPLYWCRGDSLGAGNWF